MSESRAPYRPFAQRAQVLEFCPRCELYRAQLAQREARERELLAQLAALRGLHRGETRP